MSTKKKVAALSGHNSGSRLEDLERKARNRQIAAQNAWLDLVKAQVEENAPWARVLAAAAMTGVRSEILKKQLDVSPSTFSRWVAGHHAPSEALRKRLGGEIVKLSDANKDKISAFDQPDAVGLKAG